MHKNFVVSSPLHMTPHFPLGSCNRKKVIQFFRLIFSAAIRESNLEAVSVSDPLEAGQPLRAVIQEGHFSWKTENEQDECCLFLAQAEKTGK